MANNYCKFCDRNFRFKDLYDQHAITCEFFYQRKREKDRTLEAFESNLPSSQEQYKLIQHLAVQLAKLQKEVDTLKSNTISKKRRLIIDMLNSESNPIPLMTFLEWTKTIRVSTDHLKSVFQYGLTEGMKRCIHSHIQDSCGTIPICAFSQKVNNIYIYIENEVDKSRSWRLLSNEDSDRWIDRISHLFLQEFIEWQMQNMDKINSSEDERELNLEYMRKINGIERVSGDKRKSEIRKWVYTKLERDLTTYDFV
jgi:hypothetical protein